MASAAGERKTGAGAIEREIDAAIDRLTGRVGEDASIPEPPIFRRVLVALDGTSASLHVLPWAREIARVTQARVTVVTVAPHNGIEDSAGDHAEQALLEAAVATLHAERIDAHARLLKGDVVPTLVDAARLGGHDLIVVGSNGRAGAARRFFLGSVSRGVKDHTPTAILIARSPAPPRGVLLATDGSMESRRATLAGVSLARAWQAPATLLHVETRPRGYSERVVGSAAGIELLRETGAPAERILSAAGEKNAALIVLGSRGSSAMRTLVTGSVSARVAHESPVSVLIVKAVKP